METPSGDGGRTTATATGPLEQLTTDQPPRPAVPRATPTTAGLALPLRRLFPNRTQPRTGGEIARHAVARLDEERGSASGHHSERMEFEERRLQADGRTSRKASKGLKEGLMGVGKHMAKGLLSEVMPHWTSKAAASPFTQYLLYILKYIQACKCPTLHSSLPFLVTGLIVSESQGPTSLRHKGRRGRRGLI